MVESYEVVPYVKPSSEKLALSELSQQTLHALLRLPHISPTYIPLYRVDSG